jgi:hypothetical protein
MPIGALSVILRKRRVVAAASITPTTWNPSDKHANITLSNGDLTATTGATGFFGVRSISSKSAGKFYFEVTQTSAGSPGATASGIANASEALDFFVGGGGVANHGIGWSGDGTVYMNGVGVAAIQTWAQGDTLCFAIDFDLELIWFRTNGGNWNNAAIGSQNPATGTGGIDFSASNGPYFAMVSLRTNGENNTTNFGGSAFAQAVPSGFTAGWSA